MPVSYFIGVETDPKSVKRSDLDLSRSDQYLIGMMYFAPADMSGFQVCSNASKGCIKACLVYSGHGGMIKKGETISKCNMARIERTRIFFLDRAEGFRRIKRDLDSLIRKAKKRGVKPACRLNGMSDLPWERMLDPHTGKTLFALYPTVSFYDYTASYERMRMFCEGQMPDNYWLTFSRKESKINNIQCLAVLAMGGNVAVPFLSEVYPETFYGHPTIDGTDSDLRFHDGKGKIVALCAKGKKAKADTSGFIVRERPPRLPWEASTWI